MRRIVIGIAAGLAIMASSVLPSGAGQHFGIIGGDGGTFITSTAFGPEGEPAGQVSASGFFVRGVEADARDGHVGIVTEIACISISTSQGFDRGCVRQSALPSTPDPALSSNSLRMIVPSEVHRGGMIDVYLTWTGTGELEPDTDIDTPDGETAVTVHAGVARRASVSGIVRSSTVGGGEIQMADGFLTRATTVSGCSSDQGTIC